MTTNDICEALRQKIELRWSEYQSEMLQHPAAEIFDHAKEIAAAKLCYEQLTQHQSEYNADHLEYLLRFDDPLAVVRDFWIAGESVYPSEELGYTLWTLWDKEDAEQMDYPLDPKWIPKEDGPAMC